MNILIDDEQLKSELIELTDFDNINDLKIAIQTLITEYLTDSLLPLDIIENIIIFNDGNFGEVIPIFEKSLKFNICFSKYPILFMYSPIFKKNKLYGRSIVLHELQHCKEISITNQKIHIESIEKTPFKNLKGYYLYWGYHQWSEYFAYYHSSSIYPATIKGIDKFPNILQDIEILKFNNPYDIIIIDSDEISYPENLESFVRNAIILIAHLKSNVTSDAKIKLQEFTSLSEDLKIYFEKIIQLFDNLYQNYPDNISKDRFSEIGRLLFTFS